MKVELTDEAESDLDTIAAYTYAMWGEEQAILYVTQLREACLVLLPQWLRFARPVAGYPQLRRFRAESHVIYFSEDAAGLLVVRILHERMLPELHL